MISLFSPLLAAATAVASPAPNPFGPLGATGATAPRSAAPISPQALQQLINSTAHLTPLQRAVPWLPHIFAGIFIVSAVALIMLLAFQTTKQEGLSGTIGGRVEAAYRPRLGFDQQLARLTTFVAITFVVFGTLVSITGT